MAMAPPPAVGRGTEFPEAEMGVALTAHLGASQPWSCARCLGVEEEAEAERAPCSLPTVVQSLALVTVSLEQGAWQTHGLGLMVCVLGLTLLSGRQSRYTVAGAVATWPWLDPLSSSLENS